MGFPKPSFNTEDQRRFIPSPTGEGGLNRAMRRQKNKLEKRKQCDKSNKTK